MAVFDKIEKYNGNIVAISEEGCFTYRELVLHAQQFADFVNGRKLVFIVCSNTYPSLLGYVACLRHNIVPLMLNRNTNMEMVKNLIEKYKPAFMWQPKGYYSGCEVFELYGYELIKCQSYDYPIADDLALLLTTSGSTGSPKYVRQSYKNIEENALSIIEYLAVESCDRAITTLPMSYTYGLSIINIHLMQGASIVLTEASMVQSEFWELLRKYEVNNFGGVPYVYETLKRIRFERMEVPSLKYLTQAGGKLPVELHKHFIEVCEKKEIRFIVMYGQTEATARMSWLPWENSKEKVGSIGVAIPGGEFSLIDEKNNIIADANVVGELVYKGGNVTLGYANSSEDLILGDERNGILETGDMAYSDTDGYYYITGRKKRFLKVYGNRLNLDEVDAILKDAGYEAVASGVDNHVKIYAVNGEEREIVAFLSTYTGLNINAFEVHRISEIPRSEAGKILYSKLQ